MGREEMQAIGRERLVRGGGGRWWRYVAGPVVGVAAGGVVLCLVGRRLGLSDMDQALASVSHPGWLLAALACLGVLLCADAASMAVLARALAPSVSPWAGACVTLESRLVEGATSFGGLEIPFQIMRLRGIGLSTSGASSVVLVKGLAHASVVLVTALVAIVPGVGSPITQLQRYVLIGGVLGVASLWVLIWLLFGRARGVRLLPEALQRKLEEFSRATQIIQGAGVPVFLGVMVLQILNWAATFTLVPLILMSLGWHGAVLPLVLAQALLPLVASFSPLPGGAGMAELGYLQLVGASLPGSTAVASVALWRIATWILPMAVGAATMGLRELARRRRRWACLPSVPASAVGNAVVG
jgi:glycosyltransferase 2 family protein